MNGVWSGGDIFTSLQTREDTGYNFVFLLKVYWATSANMETKPSLRNGFKWMLTSCYPDLDWTHSVLLSLLLLLSCSLCFSLAPWLRQMKMNDIGQALSFCVLQCYLNSTKRHIYECHLLIYMYQCVPTSYFFFIVSLFFLFLIWKVHVWMLWMTII